MPEDSGPTKQEVNKELTEIESGVTEAAKDGDQEELDEFADRLIAIMEEMETKVNSHDERMSQWDSVLERIERIERAIARQSRGAAHGQAEAGTGRGDAATSGAMGERTPDRGPEETHPWFRSRRLRNGDR